jgi:carbamoyltransferase
MVSCVPRLTRSASPASATTPTSRPRPSATASPIKFERILLTYLATFPRSLPSYSKAIPIWLKQKLWVPTTIRKETGYEGEILFAEHHQSHAAAAFLPSPYEEAAILTVDGVGEWATATQGMGRGNQLELIREIRFPHSLGLLYSAFTYYLGFKVNSAEYKVMGAARSSST